MKKMFTTILVSIILLTSCGTNTYSIGNDKYSIVTPSNYIMTDKSSDSSSLYVMVDKDDSSNSIYFSSMDEATLKSLGYDTSEALDSFDKIFNLNAKGSKSSKTIKILGTDATIYTANDGGLYSETAITLVGSKLILFGASSDKEKNVDSVFNDAIKTIKTK